MREQGLLYSFLCVCSFHSAWAALTYADKKVPSAETLSAYGGHFIPPPSLFPLSFPWSPFSFAFFFPCYPPASCPLSDPLYSAFSSSFHLAAPSWENSVQFQILGWTRPTSMVGRPQGLAEGTSFSSLAPLHSRFCHSLYIFPFSTVLLLTYQTTYLLCSLLLCLLLIPFIYLSPFSLVGSPSSLTHSSLAIIALWSGLGWESRMQPKVTQWDFMTEWGFKPALFQILSWNASH